MKRKGHRIICSEQEINAILAGRKTQMRRVIKHPEYFGCLTGDCPHDLQTECDAAMVGYAQRECPFGKPGSLRWIGETWVDKDAVVRLAASMPYSLSRISIQITEVRVQQIQDITNIDAIAEGCAGGPDVPRYSSRNPATPREHFIEVCDGRLWNANLWCWALTFMVVRK